MTRKLYDLWPKVQARLHPEEYKRLRTFYDATRYTVTPEDLGKHNWYAIIEALAFYEEHKRPALTKDNELIAAYETFHEESPSEL